MDILQTLVPAMVLQPFTQADVRASNPGRGDRGVLELVLLGVELGLGLLLSLDLLDYVEKAHLCVFHHHVAHRLLLLELGPLRDLELVVVGFVCAAWALDGSFELDLVELRHDEITT